MSPAFQTQVQYTASVCVVRLTGAGEMLCGAEEDESDVRVTTPHKMQHSS